MFIDPEQIENLLDILKENFSIWSKLSQTLTKPKPKLSSVKVHQMERDIASNIARYGNPLGDVRRTQQKNKMDGIKPGHHDNQNTWIQM